MYEIIGESYYRMYKQTRNQNYLMKCQEIYSIGLKYVKNAGSPIYLHRVAEIYYEYCKYKECLKICISIISRFPFYNKLPDVVFLSVCILKENNNYVQALKYIVPLIKTPPQGFRDHHILFVTGLLSEESNNNSSTQIYKSFYTSLCDDIKKVYKDYQDIINNSKPWEDYGNFYYEKGYYSMSLSFYLVAERKQPNNIESLCKKICDNAILCKNKNIYNTFILKCNDDDKKELNEQLKMIEESEDIIYEEMPTELTRVFVNEEIKEAGPSDAFEAINVIRIYLKAECTELKRLSDELLSLQRKHLPSEQYHLLNLQYKKLYEKYTECKTRYHFLTKAKKTLDEKYNNDEKELRNLNQKYGELLEKLQQYESYGDTRKLYIENRRKQYMEDHGYLLLEKALELYNSKEYEKTAKYLEVLYDIKSECHWDEDTEGNVVRILDDCFYQLYLNNNNINYLYKSYKYALDALKFNINADYFDRLYEIGKICYENGDCDATNESCDLIKKLYPINKLYPDSLLLYACSLRIVKNYSKSIEILKKLLDSLPTEMKKCDIWFLLGFIYSLEGKKDTDVSFIHFYDHIPPEIKIKYRDARKAIKDSEIWEYYGDLFMGKRLFLLSFELYLRCLGLKPKNKDEIREKIRKAISNCGELGIYLMYIILYLVKILLKLII